MTLTTLGKQCGHEDCKEMGNYWYYYGSSMAGMKVWACSKHGKEFENG